jgi:hypothetical protein
MPNFNIHNEGSHSYSSSYTPLNLKVEELSKGFIEERLKENPGQPPAWHSLAENVFKELMNGNPNDIIDFIKALKDFAGREANEKINESMKMAEGAKQFIEQLKQV